MKERQTLLFFDKAIVRVLSVYCSMILIILGVLPTGDLNAYHSADLIFSNNYSDHHCPFLLEETAGETVFELSENSEEESFNDSNTGQSLVSTVGYLIINAVDSSQDDEYRVSYQKIYILYQSLKLHC